MQGYILTDSSLEIEALIALGCQQRGLSYPLPQQPTARKQAKQTNERTNKQTNEQTNKQKPGTKQALEVMLKGENTQVHITLTSDAPNRNTV